MKRRTMAAGHVPDSGEVGDWLRDARILTIDIMYAEMRRISIVDLREVTMQPWAVFAGFLCEHAIELYNLKFLVERLYWTFGR
jgi:hypothetical protein